MFSEFFEWGYRLVAIFDATPIAVICGFGVAAIAITVFATRGRFMGPKAVARELSYALQTWDMQTRRIEFPNDRDMTSLVDLHTLSFNERVRDSSANLRRWLLEQANPNRRNLDLVDLLIITKKLILCRVLSYTYAQYYRSFNLLFIGYLAYDRRLARAADQRGKHRLQHQIRKISIPLLFRHMKKIIRWENIEGIVAEIENDREKSTLKSIFQSYADDHDVQCYQIDIKYFQPLLTADDLKKDSRGSLVGQRQELIYVPITGARHVLIMPDGHRALTKQVVLKILEFVYLKVYADAYERDANYREYLETTYGKYVAELPETIPLIPLSR